MNSSNTTRKAGQLAFPSLFDCGLYLFTFICPIMFFGTWNLWMVKQITFVFGTFALVGLSLFCKQQREYRNGYLSLIVLGSLAGVFIHASRFASVFPSIENYVTYSMMSEGFVYILCGCLLIHLTATYSKRFNISYPVLGINVLNLAFVIVQLLGINLIWNNITIPCGMMGTPYQLKIFSAISIPLLLRIRIKHILYPFFLIPLFNLVVLVWKDNALNGFLALFLGLLLYTIVTKQRSRMWFLLAIGACGAIWKYPALYGKVVTRLRIFTYTIKEIVASPWLGNGFDLALKNNFVVDVGNKNVLSYRHNDFLNIARDLGIPYLVVVIMFIKSVLQKPIHSYLWIAVVTLVIICTFQTSMYFMPVACIGCVLLGEKERENAVGKQS